MALSENTTINIRIGAIVTIIAICCTVTVRLFMDEFELKHDHERLQNTRNWTYAACFPNEPWSKNWVATHHWEDEE